MVAASRPRARARTCVLILGRGARFCAKVAEIRLILPSRAHFVDICRVEHDTKPTMARKDPADSPVNVTIPGAPIHIELNGEQKVVDPRDLLLSEAEKEEQRANQAASKEQGIVEKLVKLVYDNAAAFIFDTLVTVTPRSVLESNDTNAQSAWLDSNGFESIQDGLVTVVRMKVDGNMRVIRSMQAKVDSSYASDVETWIRKQTAAQLAAQSTTATAKGTK